MSTGTGHINRRSFVAIGAAGSIGVPVQAAARDGAADPWASGFTNRQSFVRAVRDGLRVADGGCVIAGPLAYRAKTGAHAIGDLPGWLPLFDVFADHFGQNSIPGETDMTEAINQAIAYVDASGGGDVNFFPGTYLVDRHGREAENFDLNVCIRVNTAAPVRLVGAGRDVTEIRKRPNGTIAHVIKFGQRVGEHVKAPGGGVHGLTVVGNFGATDIAPDTPGGNNIDVSEGATGLVLENFASRAAHGYGVGWQRSHFRNCAMRDFIIETTGQDGVDAKCDANARGNGNNMIENGTVRDAGLSHPKQAAVDVRVGWQVRDLTVECGPGVVGLRTQHDADPETDNDAMLFLSSVSDVHVLAHGADSKGYQFGIHNQIASNCTAVGAEINFFIRSIDGKYVNLIGRDAKGVNLTVYTSEAGGASGNCFTGCDMTGAGFLDVRVQGPGTVTDTLFVGLTAGQVELSEAAQRTQMIGGRIEALEDRGAGTMAILPG